MRSHARVALHLLAQFFFEIDRGRRHVWCGFSLSALPRDDGWQLGNNLELVDDDGHDFSE